MFDQKIAELKSLLDAHAIPVYHIISDELYTIPAEGVSGQPGYKSFIIVSIPAYEPEVDIYYEQDLHFNSEMSASEIFASLKSRFDENPWQL